VDVMGFTILTFLLFSPVKKQFAAEAPFSHPK
jgi:hypothetical protein